jgi:LysM repeat protein
MKTPTMNTTFKSFFILLFLLSLGTMANAQIQAEDYIQNYKHIAIREMKYHGVPASITLAQGILESGMGTSMLATKANNHFGIKCHKEWTGKTIRHTDDAPNECFRVYNNAEESFKDHSQFLLSRPWYAPLFKLDVQDYKGWAHGLKKAGYATNPRYAEMLIDIIERHMLYVYDENISLHEMEEKRMALKQKEKEELLVMQNKSTPISTQSVCVEASLPCVVPSNPHYSVFYNNKLKTVHVQKGETMKVLSSRYKIALTKLYQYNDMPMNSALEPGQLVYLQPKKSKAKQKTHLVLSHETMWSISQSYGIQLQKLYERNLLNKGEEPAAGTTLYLNKRAPKKPAIRNGKQPGTPERIVVEVPVTIDPVIIPANQPSLPLNNAPIIKPSSNPAPPKPATSSVADVLNNSQPSASAASQAANSSITHLVEKGDTLYNISKRYNVSVSQLKEWNNIFDDSIKLGQILIIKQ